ncbi:MAG: GLPGLI family protein [Bacteroidota bacterium]|nr:GLPGLI family protein [Bacteroidota bacterium]
MQNKLFKYIFTICIFCSTNYIIAQKFINTARVEYERKTYIKKILQESGDNDNSEWMARLPDYRTEYFDLYFSGNKSVYKTGKESDQKIPEWMSAGIISTVYTNTDSGTYFSQKQIYDQSYNIIDSLPHIDWKITDDTRTIAGYTCRRATGRVCDSLFVVAFYTEEILLSGGPETFNGLPGLILGVVIPRMHMSWYATKVDFPEIKPEQTTPPATKKGKQIKLKAMLKELKESVNDWGNWKNTLLWQAAM